MATLGAEGRTQTLPGRPRLRPSIHTKCQHLLYASHLAMKVARSGGEIRASRESGVDAAPDRPKHVRRSHSAPRANYRSLSEELGASRAAGQGRPDTGETGRECCGERSVPSCASAGPRGRDIECSCRGRHPRALRGRNRWPRCPISSRRAIGSQGRGAGVTDHTPGRALDVNGSVQAALTEVRMISASRGTSSP
jgi:hypothetical protein